MAIAPADTATASAVLSVDEGGGEQMLNGAGIFVPEGGISGDATIVIRQVPKTDDTARQTMGSTGFVFEFTALGSDGSELDPGDINYMEITLPLDLSVVQPGDLENGLYTIYYAADLAALEAGQGMAVPIENYLQTDYIGLNGVGSARFWMDHVTAFALGLPVAAGGGVAIDDDDSNCFIASTRTAGESLPLVLVSLVLIVGLAARQWIRARR